MRALTAGLLFVWIAQATAADVPQFSPDIGSFKDQWYGKQLQALQERPLCCASGSGGRVIRFLWLRSSHHPVVVRLIEAKHGNWQTVIKVGNGIGGRDPAPDATFTEEEHSLSAAQAAALLAAFEPASWFWSTASEASEKCVADPGTECISVSGDGGQWIFEARDGARYHYVDRFSPNAGPVRNLGERFLALSQRDLGKVY
jgi:hypothetical protein